MASSCASSTLNKRTTCWRHWLRFLRHSGFSIHPIRPSELHVCLWIVWLFKKKRYAYTTIRSYLYSLASELKFRGGIDIVAEDRSWFIHSTLKHYKKSLGTAPIIYRRALTVDLLEKLLLSVDLSKFDNYVYGTMLTVGVYCLLRVGEICYSKMGKNFKFIRNKDLKFESNCIEFKLWFTKTDQEKRGVTKWISNISTKFNPFQMMVRLKSMKTTDTGHEEPFFALKNRKPVSRLMLVDFLQREMKVIYPNIDSKEWTGISMRKGGATSALRAGVPGEIIQVMGNWKTEIYKSYLDQSITDVSHAQRLMATINTKQ